MALGRPVRPGDVRDEKADLIAAHLEEYETYARAGMQERANQVAVVLGKLGHAIEKVPAGAKQRAVAEEPVERAVETEEAPKRRPGRPKKATATEE